MMWAAARRHHLQVATQRQQKRMVSNGEGKLLKNYIGGHFRNAESGKTIPNVNPATSEILSSIPDSSAEDVSLAVDAAKNAFKNEWGRTTLKERARWCRLIGEKIRERHEELALAETRDTGKPIQLSMSLDIPRSAENFEFFASAAEVSSLDMHPSDHGFNYTLRKPLGVVGLITPWNLPLYLLTWKIAPALMMGNTIVAKPSELTPTTATLLAEICSDIGLPEGVFNVVHGYGDTVGKPIVEHEDILGISFTGGTNTGSNVAASAASRFKKLSLELGGKNPNIIFADCDLEKAISTSVRSSFTNSGQICLCGSRIFVQKSIKTEFETKFLEEVKKLKLGNPEDRSVSLGSLVSLDHRDKIESYIKLAVKEGGIILHGGERPMLDEPYNNGAYIEPIIVANLPHTSRTAQEEIFGPFVTIHEFEDETDVINQANSVKYGLSASIWTQNLDRAHRVAQLVDAGIVWINSWLVRDLSTPFGGMKASGVGREGGKYSLEFFSEPKNVYVHVPVLSPDTRTTTILPTSPSEPPKQQCERKGIHVKDAPAPVGAYPHARRHGDLFFLSGIGPRQPGTNDIPGGPIENEDGTRNDAYDIRAQTRAVIKNVETILQNSGLSMENILDVQVFLVDMKRDFEGFNAVYKEHFEGLNATRTTCSVLALPTPIAVEFKVIASAK